VTWHAGLAYLAYASCTFHGTYCTTGAPSVLEVRDPAAALDAPALGRLDLSYSQALAVLLEQDGVPYLLIGRDGPRPGLFVVSIAQPTAPRLVQFVDLPVAPARLAAAGPHVYVAAGSAGLIVLTAAPSSGG
jgi:hypothetical protein